MNFNKFINSDYLKENPLCGISTYKDELNLATGACTRKIKKMVLTGEENITSTHLDINLFNFNVTDYRFEQINTTICTHYETQNNVIGFTRVDNKKICFYAGNETEVRILYLRDSNFATIDELKTFLRGQYANGTPVTIWYILAEPTTETITVPSGLSGIEEGYLIQDGTPTPSNPIYPTANEVPMWS